MYTQRKSMSYTFRNFSKHSIPKALFLTVVCNSMLSAMNIANELTILNETCVSAERIDSFARYIADLPPNAVLLEAINKAKSHPEQWQKSLLLELIQKRLIPFLVPADYTQIAPKDADIVLSAINVSGKRFGCLLADGKIKITVINHPFVLTQEFGEKSDGKPVAMAWQGENALVVVFENVYYVVTFTIDLEVSCIKRFSFQEKNLAAVTLNKETLQGLAIDSQNKVWQLSIHPKGYSASSEKRELGELRYKAFTKECTLVSIKERQPDTLYFEVEDGNQKSIALPSTPLAVNISPDGSYVGCLCNNKIYVYLLSHGILIDTIASENVISCFAFSPCNRYIAYGSAEGYVMMFDIKRKECKAFCKHSSRVQEVVFSANGDVILTCSKNELRCTVLGEYYRAFTLEQLIVLLKCWQYSYDKVIEEAEFKKVITTLLANSARTKLLEQFIDECSQCSLCCERRADCQLYCKHSCCKICLVKHLTEQYNCMVCRERIRRFMGPDKEYIVEYELKLS